MEDVLLYYVYTKDSFVAEGRVFHAYVDYPVFEKDEKYVVLCGENGDFCFSKSLMEDVIKEWDLTVKKELNN